MLFGKRNTLLFLGIGVLYLVKCYALCVMTEGIVTKTSFREDIEMKKKIITLAMAAVMTFALNITAVAAPSVTASVYAADGKTEVAASAVTGGITATTVDLKSGAEEQTAALAEAAAKENVTVEKTVVVEITGTLPGDGVVEIKVSGFGLKAGDDVLVQHYYAGAWHTEKLAVVTGDDTIKISGLTTLSPFTISKIAAKSTASSTATAAAVTSTANATSTATSPKTGFSVLKAVVDLF